MSSIRNGGYRTSFIGYSLNLMSFGGIATTMVSRISIIVKVLYAQYDTLFSEDEMVTSVRSLQQIQQSGKRSGEIGGLRDQHHRTMHVVKRSGSLTASCCFGVFNTLVGLRAGSDVKVPSSCATHPLAYGHRDFRKIVPQSGMEPTA